MRDSGRSVRGRVFTGHNPFADVVVHVNGVTTFTDDEGWFGVEDVSEIYRLVPSSTKTPASRRAG
jgi:hypothetical protein